MALRHHPFISFSRSCTDSLINFFGESLVIVSDNFSARPSPSWPHRALRRPSSGFPFMFSNFSIRAKFMTVVAVLLDAMIGMGLLAVKNMRSINASTVDIATNWLPSVRVLGDLRAGVITYRNVVREHMLAETLDEKLAAERTLATVVESNTKIRATYEPLITSPEERALYN